MTTSITHLPTTGLPKGEMAQREVETTAYIAQTVNSQSHSGEVNVIDIQTSQQCRSERNIVIQTGIFQTQLSDRIGIVPYICTDIFQNSSAQGSSQTHRITWHDNTDRHIAQIGTGKTNLQGGGFSLGRGILTGCITEKYIQVGITHMSYTQRGCILYKGIVNGDLHLKPAQFTLQANIIQKVAGIQASPQQRNLIK